MKKKEAKGKTYNNCESNNNDALRKRSLFNTSTQIGAEGVESGVCHGNRGADHIIAAVIDGLSDCDKAACSVIAL